MIMGHQSDRLVNASYHGHPEYIRYVYMGGILTVFQIISSKQELHVLPKGAKNLQASTNCKRNNAFSLYHQNAHALVQESLSDLYSTVISLSSICADVEKKFLKTGQILAALTLVHLGHLQLSSPYPKGLYNEFEKI